MKLIYWLIGLVYFCFAFNSRYLLNYLLSYLTDGAG